MSPTVLDPQSPVAAVPLNGDIERGYELINGRLVEMPPMSNRDMTVADNVLLHLLPFIRQRRLGRAGREWIVRLHPDAPRTWRPDAAFVSYDRWPADRPMPESDPWDVAPDWVLEVISHTNSCDDLMDRLQAYFGAGVRQVWVIYPRHERIYQYLTETEIRVLAPSDEIDGGTLFAGLRIPVRALFEGVA